MMLSIQNTYTVPIYDIASPAVLVARERIRWYQRCVNLV